MMCYYCGAPCLTCHLWYRPPRCHLFSTYRLPLPLSSIQLPSLHPHGTSSARRPLVSCHVSLSFPVTSSCTPTLHAPSSSVLFRPRGIPQLMSQLPFLLHHLHSVHAFNPRHTLVHIRHRDPSQQSSEVASKEETVRLIQVAPLGDLHVPEGRVDRGCP
jgi:hypothetical protein